MEYLIIMKAGRVIAGIKIRVAKLEDTDSIASVLYESFAEIESIYTAEAFAATTLTSEQLRARWNEVPVWVVALNSDVVGTIAFYDGKETTQFKFKPTFSQKKLGVRCLMKCGFERPSSIALFV